MPVKDSYSSYVDTGRQFVLWNVVATPEFSLEPLNWCYPVVGCLSYRGYFSRQQAVDFAEELSDQGFDVHIAGVTAYSTLGWFDDPLVNTMLKFDDVFLAKVMFHEIAHQLLYFRDDTEFNEAFADAVAEHGVKTWLSRRGQLESITEFEAAQSRQSEFNRLVKLYQDRLDTLYGSDLTEAEMRSAKAQTFEQMQTDYAGIRQAWDSGNYDNWFASPLNNARLALVLTYRELVPNFTRLLSASQADPAAFYDRVRTLEDCTAQERRAFLEQDIEAVKC